MVFGKQKPYVSPEAFEAIIAKSEMSMKMIQSSKNDVFVLGLCILESGVMSNCTNIYDVSNKRFK